MAKKFVSLMMAAVMTIGISVCGSAAEASQSGEMDPDDLNYRFSEMYWSESKSKLMVEGEFVNCSDGYDIVGLDEAQIRIQMGNELIAAVDVDTEAVEIIPHNGSYTYNFAVSGLEEDQAREIAANAIAAEFCLDADFSYAECEGIGCGYCEGVDHGYCHEGDYGDEEREMCITVAMDDEEYVFWQRETEISDEGNLIGEYSSFDENGKELYRIRLVLSNDLERTSYSKTSGGSNDVYFTCIWKFPKEFSVEDSYGLTSVGGKYLWPDCSYHLTVTEADSMNRHYHGVFEGVMSAYEGGSQVEITDAEFDYVYGGVSPYCSSKGCDDHSNSGSGARNSAADDKCSRCGGSGYCSYCDGLGKYECSCLGGICSSCSGMGYKQVWTKDGYEYPDCTACGGTGDHGRCSGAGWLNCTSCDGTGICPYCNGTGER